MVANSTAARPQVQDHRSHVQDHRGTPPVVVRDTPPPAAVPPRRPAVAYEPHSSVVRDHRPDFRATARSDFDNIFSRNDLSLEDKIMLLLFKVMGKMDEELTEKTKNLSEAKSSTTQNGNRGGGVDGSTSTNGNSAANGKDSLDSQTLELQQLVNRRNNLFSTISAIVHKFDESAGKVINKLSQG